MIMNTFHLQIVTPDGLMFDGDAEKYLFVQRRATLVL